jgi:murein L,D-transpeptidase YafK
VRTPQQLLQAGAQRVARCAPAALASIVAGVFVAGTSLVAAAGPQDGSRLTVPAQRVQSVASAAATSPEQRLIGIYQLIGKARMNDALQQVDALVRDVPNFRLAHLVRGDLLMARQGALTGFAGGVPKLLVKTPEQQERLDQMRQEAALRLQSLREVPPNDRIPRQFVSLSQSTRHAIAVDTSRARLYLFAHRGDGRLSLVSSHYASIGRSGVDKRVEGDKRTPLGVYYITSKLSKAQVDDFYGAGALPINYPNEYDRGLGRTGSGIWLHGVSRDDYSRAPRITDGCVALANDELDYLLRTVEARSTPVVIAERIDWVSHQDLDEERRTAAALLDAWHSSKSNPDKLASFYAPRATVASSSQATAQPLQATAQARRAAASSQATTLIKDVSVLSWRDSKDVLVVTFGEVPRGAKSGAVLRQYWERDGRAWRIVHERVIG